MVKVIIGIILFTTTILSSCSSSEENYSSGNNSNLLGEPSGVPVQNHDHAPKKHSTESDQSSSPKDEKTKYAEPNTNKITVCECENLVFEYLEKKSKAKTEEEKIQLSIEESKKNIECYELEKFLGDKLKEEQAKCNL